MLLDSSLIAILPLVTSAFNRAASPFPTNRQRIALAVLPKATKINVAENPFASFFNGSPWAKFGSTPSSESGSKTVVDKYYELRNDRNANAASDLFSDDCEYLDTNNYQPFDGKKELRRNFLLEANASSSSRKRVIDDRAVSRDGTDVCVKWHVEENGVSIENERGCSYYKVGEEDRITAAIDVPEPKSKPGDAGLNILSAASKIIGNTGVGYVDAGEADSSTLTNGATAVERYFDAWNRRDMEDAVSCFADDCEYEDTQYADAFCGKEKLETHLLRVAECLPRTFAFAIDDFVVDNANVGVRWHLETEDGDALPFTRGCSFYKLDERGLINYGFDVPEPAVVKTGGLDLFLDSVATSVSTEPIRMIPILMWAAYMWIVFFSDGILPGANALMLEQRTWEEVINLSINFFLVSPILHLPFSPLVHPMLEGVFNLLLSWAAMFAGFLSDDREDKPNLFPMLPAVAGMQFLTSAFLLPYLALRTSENLDIAADGVFEDDLDTIPGTLGEFRGLGALMGAVGSGSIVWFFIGRPEFGQFGERYSTFIDLLSIDRVGSSFVVDLAIFALFQGWLVDDDMRRRGVDVDSGEMAVLRNTAKFVPFFGLAAYLSLRPPLSVRS